MLNLPTLKYRRKRGDLIQVFKILNGHYDINWEDFFTLDTDRTHNTRGHSKKLVKHRTLTSLTRDINIQNDVVAVDDGGGVSVKGKMNF